MSALTLSLESKEELSIRRFAVHEGLSSLFSVSVWARTPNDDLDLDEIVGMKASLSITSGMAFARFGGARRWSGVCRTMEHVSSESTGLSMYYLRIAPTLWLLTQRHNHRLFQHQSIPDIVRKLLGEWHIDAEWRIDEGEHPKLELRIQYGESDFAFFSRMLEEAGITYFFVDGEHGSKLVLSDAPQSAEPREGGPVLYADNPNRSSELEYVSQVRLSRDVRPGKVTVRDHDFRRKHESKLLGETPLLAGRRSIEDRLEVYSYRPGASLVEMEESAAKKLDAAIGAGAGFAKKLGDEAKHLALEGAEKGITKLDSWAQGKLAGKAHGLAAAAEHEAAGLALAGLHGGMKGVVDKAERDLDGLVKKAEDYAGKKVGGLVGKELGKLAGGVVGDLAGELAGDLAHNIAGKITGKIAGGVKHELDKLVGDDKGFARHDEKAALKRSMTLLESMRATRFRVSFSTNAFDLEPGTVFSIMSHPRSSLGPDRLLLVTELMVEGTHDGEWDATGQAVFADQPYRPVPTTPKPSIQGMQSAVVVGPKGEEIHTDEHGRIRVQFHWDREGEHDESSSCWMRVAHGWAGAGYGMIAIPRVGQEVMVSFLEGDPDLPAVVGSAFSNASRVPHGLPGHKTRSSWRSSSSPGGDGANEVMMDDAKGKELVYMLAERNMQHIVKKDRGAVVGKVDSILVGEKYSVHVAQAAVPPPTVVPTGLEIVDEKITLTTGEASITLEKDTVTIRAKKVITIHSEGDDIRIQGGPNVMINCGVDGKDEPPAGDQPAGGQPAPGAGKKVTTGLGDDVDKEVAKSPTLSAKVDSLQSKGWKLQYGPAGQGTATYPNTKTIVFDENDKGNTATILGTLAHECGHATYSPPFVGVAGHSKDEYVAQNVNAALMSEGEATMTAIDVKNELAANGGPAIVVPGTHVAEYQAIHDKYPAAADRDKAREEIGNIFAKGEYPSTDKKKTYVDSYSGWYATHYDQIVGK